MIFPWILAQVVADPDAVDDLSGLRTMAQVSPSRSSVPIIRRESSA